MKLQQAGFQPSAKGPADDFTGTVRVDSPFKGSGQLSGMRGPIREPDD